MKTESLNKISISLKKRSKTVLKSWLHKSKRNLTRNQMMKNQRVLFSPSSSSFTPTLSIWVTTGKVIRIPLRARALNKSINCQVNWPSQSTLSISRVLKLRPWTSMTPLWCLSTLKSITWILTCSTRWTRITEVRNLISQRKLWRLECLLSVQLTSPKKYWTNTIETIWKSKSKVKKLWKVFKSRKWTMKWKSDATRKKEVSSLHQLLKTKRIKTKRTPPQTTLCHNLKRPVLVSQNLGSWWTRPNRSKISMSWSQKLIKDKWKRISVMFLQSSVKNSCRLWKTQRLQVRRMTMKVIISKRMVLSSNKMTLNLALNWILQPSLIKNLSSLKLAQGKRSKPKNQKLRKFLKFHSHGKMLRGLNWNLR